MLPELPEDWSLVSSAHVWQLSAACNSSFRGSHSLFWPPKALNLVHNYSSHTHKKSKVLLKNQWGESLQVWWLVPVVLVLCEAKATGSLGAQSQHGIQKPYPAHLLLRKIDETLFNKPGIITHLCNPSTVEVEARGIRSSEHSLLHSRVQGQTTGDNFSFLRLSIYLFVHSFICQRQGFSV